MTEHNSKDVQLIERNSEILFLYDAQMCNPNGDMDNENKPRMDFDTNINLVSDVRLKRYLRDYFETGLGEEIFITSKAENAQARTKELEKIKKAKKEKAVKDKEEILHFDLIDVRLFGAVTTESDTTGGHYTGPVQFNWGYSLHPVELVDSVTITSSFSSGKGVGKDYRLYYSLIAFSGSINASVAKTTPMTTDDLKLFDEAMLKSIPFLRTRSKIGQYPRFYLRVELKDKLSFLKDLRSMIDLVPKDHIGENLHLIRKIDDYELDMSKLVAYLEENKGLIQTIYLWQDSELNLKDPKKSGENGESEKLDIAIELEKVAKVVKLDKPEEELKQTKSETPLDAQ